MQKLMEKHRKAMATNGGFTLVELIVVIAIIAILAAVLVPQYIQYVERSRQGVDINYMGEVAHNVAIEAASMEDAVGVDFTVTFTHAGTYTVAADGISTADIAALTTSVEAVVTPANFESKRFGDSTADNIEITVTASGTIDGLPTANNSSTAYTAPTT